MKNARLRTHLNLDRRQSLVPRQLTDIAEGDEDNDDEESTLVSNLQNRLNKLQREVAYIREENESLSKEELQSNKRTEPSSSSIGRGVWGSVANALEGDVDFASLGLNHSFESVPSEGVESEDCSSWSLEKLMQETELALQSDDPERVMVLQTEVDRRVSIMAKQQAIDEAALEPKHKREVEPEVEPELEHRPEPSAEVEVRSASKNETFPDTEIGSKTEFKSEVKSKNEAEYDAPPSFSTYPKKFSNHDASVPNSKIITKRKGFRASVFEPRTSSFRAKSKERRIPGKAHQICSISMATPVV